MISKSYCNIFRYGNGTVVFFLDTYPEIIIDKVI